MDVVIFAAMVFNLFLIVDPIGCLPLFITITKNNTMGERKKMILRAVIIAFLVLAFFAIVGHQLLAYFSIGVPAVRIAGGILIFTIGIEMLFGHVSRTESTEAEQKEALKKQDISITPLAIPLLAGPGAITAVMLFAGTGDGHASAILFTLAAIFIVLFSSWFILRFSSTLVRVLGHIGVTVIARVMGLLLIFVAAQLVIDGLAMLGVVKSALG